MRTARIEDAHYKLGDKAKYNDLKVGDFFVWPNVGEDWDVSNVRQRVEVFRPRQGGFFTHRIWSIDAHYTDHSNPDVIPLVKVDRAEEPHPPCIDAEAPYLTLNDKLDILHCEDPQHDLVEHFDFLGPALQGAFTGEEGYDDWALYRPAYSQHYMLLGYFVLVGREGRDPALFFTHQQPSLCGDSPTVWTGMDEVDGPMDWASIEADGAYSPSTKG